MKRIYIWSAAIVIIAVCLVYLVGFSGRSEPDTAPVQTVEPTAEVNEAVAAPVTLPEDMLRLLNLGGYSIDSIPGTQLIIADCQDTYTELRLFVKGTDGGWSEAGDPIAGRTGKNGVSAAKTEGDLKTPAGLFTLGPAFGIKDKPETKMSYRRVTENSYWVDDPASALYNTWTESTDDRDWSSAEHLIEYSPQYNYSVVINYNTDPTVPGAGSAIFLHCGSGTTSGCLAITEEDMLALLAWLDEAAAPAILICR